MGEGLCAGRDCAKTSAMVAEVTRLDEIAAAHARADPHMQASSSTSPSWAVNYSALMRRPPNATSGSWNSLSRTPPGRALVHRTGSSGMIKRPRSFHFLDAGLLAALRGLTAERLGRRTVKRSGRSSKKPSCSPEIAKLITWTESRGDDSFIIIPLSAIKDQYESRPGAGT